MQHKQIQINWKKLTNGCKKCNYCITTKHNCCINLYEGRKINEFLNIEVSKGKFQKQLLKKAV